MGVGRQALGVGCWAPARWLAFAVGLTWLTGSAGCRGTSPQRPTPNTQRLAPITLKDVAAEAGLQFRHTSGASGRFYMPETLGSGCAFLDYNGDGHFDIFLVNSTHLPGSPRTPPHPTQALYRNRGDGTFEDVTKAAGLAVELYGMGCAAADYDNDGDPDLYVSALGPDRLYRNNGDGTFSDATKSAGIDAPEWNTSVVWFDYDRDGWLDLYACGYCRWTPQTNRLCPDVQGRNHMCTPELYQGVSGRLYRNRGSGAFTDVTKTAGMFEPAGKGLAALAIDENDDGWPDLVVANDLEPNLLFRNQKNGTFREVGSEVGVAFSKAGAARAGMGLDSGGLATGREALLVGNFSAEGLGLYRADEGGQFTDIADAAGLVPASLPFLTFGVLFCDLDMDGRPEILTANGHIDPNAELAGKGVTFRQRLQLFRQEPDPGAAGARFRDVTAEAGPDLQRAGLYRGLAVADYDRDGDPDVLVSQNAGSPLLLRDETNGAHWLQVRLQAAKGNRDAIGARLRLTAAGQPGVQTRWIRSGSTYGSSSAPIAYFGLGPATTVERLEIRWPSGATQTLTNVRADQVLTVKEGEK
jgi:enediyne biosynthesis protein E4